MKSSSDREMEEWRNGKVWAYSPFIDIVYCTALRGILGRGRNNSLSNICIPRAGSEIGLSYIWRHLEQKSCTETVSKSKEGAA